MGWESEQFRGKNVERSIVWLGGVKQHDGKDIFLEDSGHREQ